MLQAEHICCGYGGEPVVRDVSFSVKPGEHLCIMGPNGCGKTTLLRALAGLLPRQGSITIAGQDLRGMKRRQIARNVAMMSQLTSVYFSYTVYETVMLGRYAHRGPGALQGADRQDREIVLDCLERTGLLPLADRPITQLSGGQLQRVFLARTFAQSPRIILLDEPTNHLDLKYQVELVAELRRWSAAGDRCVVGVLHDINLALEFADRVLLLEKGEVRGIYPADDFDLEALSRVYQMDVAGYMRRCLKKWE